MDSKDLRIGNYIYDRFELIAMAEEIRQHSVKLSSIHDGGYKFESYSIGEVRPIPLTEDWLLKFGFEKEKEYFTYFITKDDKLNPHIDVWFMEERTVAELCRSGVCFKMVTCNYVHQLQNLYFALAGKELTFI